MPHDKDNNAIIKRFERVRKRYQARTEAIQGLYRLYEQIDERREEGFASIATSDARVAMDLAVHILSRHPHIDRIPQTVQDRAQLFYQSKAERFLSGLWRTIDQRELLRGQAWHQRRLASWILMTGWYGMFVAIGPDSRGQPKAFADFLDPNMVYPTWDGPDGSLGTVDVLYPMSLMGLQTLAAQQEWGVSGLDGDEEQVVWLLNHWESRYNPQDPEQPDILQAVYHSVNIASPHDVDRPTHLEEPVAWDEIQPLVNRVTERSAGGGFLEIPILVGPVPGVELSMAYYTDAMDVLKRRGHGLLSAMKAEKEMIDQFLTKLLQDEQLGTRFRSQIQVASPAGNETLKSDEIGGIHATMSDVEIKQPLVYDVQLGAKQLILQALEARLQRAGFSWSMFGMVDTNLSGVAIERLNEWARSRVGPFQILMERLYEQVGYVWLRDYRRRWQGRRRFGTLRLQGTDLRSGLFDEEFRPDEIPEVRYVKSTVALALAEDDMMKANIARALNPDLRMSPDYIRENVLKVQDPQLEARRAAEGRIEQSPFWINVQMLNRLRDEANAALAAGDTLGAQLLGAAASQLMQSLSPSQGRGIPEEQGQGFPEAGGNLTNAAGAIPALAPGNQTQGTAIPEAPAAPTAQAQARRNV